MEIPNLLNSAEILSPNIRLTDFLLLKKGVLVLFNSMERSLTQLPIKFV